LPWTPASTPAGWWKIGAALFSCLLSLAAGPASAQGAQLRPAGSGVEVWIAEAAERFALPDGWIRSVIRAESGFDARAVSRAGALGLMQLMPATYAQMRLRYGLGADPFDPHDNVLAGAAYLRAMVDQFGVRGGLAAYNAGPGRYLMHLAAGEALPPETRAYVGDLAPQLGSGGQPAIFPRISRPPVDGLFAVLEPAATAPDAARASHTDNDLFVVLTPNSGR
jgi:soluble lytic murein transglycosylase-like protein